MLYTVQELENLKKVYIVYFPNNERYYGSEVFPYAVYTVSKFERRGFNKAFVQLKTSAARKGFKQNINLVGGAILNNSDVGYFADYDSALKSFCRHVKKNIDGFPKLGKKLIEQFPEQFC